MHLVTEYYPFGKYTCPTSRCNPVPPHYRILLGAHPDSGAAPNPVRYSLSEPIRSSHCQTIYESFTAPMQVAPTHERTSERVQRCNGAPVQEGASAHAHDCNLDQQRRRGKNHRTISFDCFQSPAAILADSDAIFCSSPLLGTFLFAFADIAADFAGGPLTLAELLHIGPVRLYCIYANFRL